MSTFWNPRNSQLSELWARCDSCLVSGPASAFNWYWTFSDRAFERGMLHLCLECVPLLHQVAKDLEVTILE